jgi:Ca-activated chloride channel family protein
MPAWVKGYAVMPRRIRFFLPLACALLLSAPEYGGLHAEDRIKLAVEPSQSVLPAGQSSKVYLRIKLEGLAEEAISRPPVNVSLVIDRSGSMTGDKIEQAKEAAILALSRLSSQDRVSVIAFDHRVEVVVPAGPFENFDEMRRRIEAIRPGGQTAIYAAVRQAGQGMSGAVSPERVSRIILMSDGQANVGPSSPAELEKLGRELGGQGIAVTTIGLGLDYSEDLMTRLALASDGNHAFVENPEQLAGIFNDEFGDVLSVVGQDLEIEITCPEGVTPIRGLGRDVKIEGRRMSFRLNQIAGRQERYLIVELEVGKDAARAKATLAEASISYLDPKSKTRTRIQAKADISFEASPEEAARSGNPSVLAAVAMQIANERSERAVLARDNGSIADATRQLQENAAYLQAEADRLQAQAPALAAPLRDLAKKFSADASALSNEKWDRQRKSMKADQYRSKTQQNYSGVPDSAR